MLVYIATYPRCGSALLRDLIFRNWLYLTANGYGAAGVSIVSEVGAIDGGIRQDIVMNGTTPRATVVAVSLRLFIPAQQPMLQ